MDSSPHILILAAGRGKRMHSKLVKVVHPVLFRPMLHYVLDLAFSIPHQSVSVVVGFGEDEVRDKCFEYPEVRIIQQANPLGTADAVKSAEPFLASEEGSVLILSGDVILLSKISIKQLIQMHLENEAMATLVTAEVAKPKGYGRIIRDNQGEVIGIREEVDCTQDEKKIKEVNAGIYCFDIKALFDELSKIKNENKQQEFYLTDVIGVFAADKRKLVSVMLRDPAEMMGINDRFALSQVEEELQKRWNRSLMLRGVTIQNPGSVFIDKRSRIEADVVVEQGCQIINSVVESGAWIESGCRIERSAVGKRCRIKQGSYLSESLVGSGCLVGPYAQLRPGTRLGDGVKVGNFVEIKKSILRDGVKASHLSYIGDAEIGKDVNVGCGFITCNYDGKKKNKTIIEDGVFIGSDSQTVAPVRIGRGSYVASGTTVTEDVPEDSLVISRGKQVTKAGYAKKYNEPITGKSVNEKSTESSDT